MDGADVEGVGVAVVSDGSHLIFRACIHRTDLRASVLAPLGDKRARFINLLSQCAKPTRRAV